MSDQFEYDLSDAMGAERAWQDEREAVRQRQLEARTAADWDVSRDPDVSVQP